METHKTVLKEFLKDMENEKETFSFDEELKSLKKKIKDRVIKETPLFE